MIDYTFLGIILHYNNITSWKVLIKIIQFKLFSFNKNNDSNFTYVYMTITCLTSLFICVFLFNLQFNSVILSYVGNLDVPWLYFVL